MTDEFDKLNETLKSLAADLKSRRQISLAITAGERIAHLGTVKRAFIAAHPPTTDFMSWGTVKKTLQKNTYGLSTSECLALGMSLIEAAPLGLKMAGVEFVARTTLSELGAESNRFLNSFWSILNEPIVQDSQELTRAEELVTEFLSSVESLLGPIEHIAEIQPEKEVVSAIASAKFACAKRELDSWQIKNMKDIGNRLNAESTDLMKDIGPHIAIDDVIEAICEEHRRKSSVEPNGNIFPFNKAISYFAFGMALELSKRAELEEDPQRTLLRTAASVASSLVKHGLGPNEVIFYKTTFFDTLFDIQSTSASDELRAWIQAGATSMDRYCRTNSDQFLGDFTKSSLFL